MIGNNIKVSFRVFKRNKSYTFINILGMSTGLAIALLILLYVRFELSYENNIPAADRLVRITMDYLSGETVIDQDAEMYPPVAPRMAAEFSEVESFVRVVPFSEVTIKAGDDFFRETKMFAVDSTFFDLFNYPLRYGNTNRIFSAPFEVVLTESHAIKYFNRLDVLGESLWVSKFDRLCKITGVVADSPHNTHFKFDILISYASIKDEAKQWNYNNNELYAYLLLSDNIGNSSFLTNLDAFNDRLHKEDRIATERIVAQPIKDIHLYSHKSYEMEQSGDATSVFFLLGVALLVIIIAVVNYINLSTAKSLDRAKEVGIRKVVGSSLAQLRIQFFTESLLINFLAGVFAIIFIVLALPAFRNMAGLPEGFHFWNDHQFWVLLVGILLLSTLVSGVFPAFILSSFQPISVLKGKFSRSTQGMLLRKGLVIFQFSMTIFLLIQTFTAERQLSYMRAKNLGLDIEHTIVVRMPNDKQLIDKTRVFTDQLLSHSQFQAISLSSCVPGQPTSALSSTNGGVDLVGALEKNSFNFYIYLIDAAFISTMQMELKYGENFIPDSPNASKIIVNEESVKLWGIPDAESAVGKKIDLWGEQRTIVGVIRNFNQRSAKDPYLPMLFLYGDEEDYGKSFACIRTQSGNLKEELNLVKQVYEPVFPDSPFEYFFLDQEFDKQYRSEEQFQNVFGTLTGFAIMISCLGLFGLVSFTVANKTKEIGVRKVLGANTRQVVALLSKDFVSLILISMVISISVTYFLVSSWLQRYAYRIDLSIWLFAIPAIGVLLISLLTILAKTFQVSSANPVNSLKEE